MLSQILFIVLSLVILTAGADFLVRGASSIALRLGMTPLVVGLTVVAFGTSAPELVVSLKAAWMQQGDIAAGNVVGSNIFNIGAILGLAALVSPMRVQLQLLRFDTPIMVVTALALAGMLWDKRIDRWEGLILAVGIVVYVTVNVLMARTQHSKEIDAEFSEGVPHQTKSPWIDVLLLLGGLGLLVLGSRILVENAVAMARNLGVSEAVIGLTIVAAGTSMPELATSVVAAFKKEADIAIGNIIGSNIFNILGIVGISASVFPFEAAGIRTVDLYYMIAITVLLVPMLFTGKKISRAEGLVLLMAFTGYLALVWPKTGA